MKWIYDESVCGFSIEDDKYMGDAGWFRGGHADCPEWDWFHALKMANFDYAEYVDLITNWNEHSNRREFCFSFLHFRTCWRVIENAGPRLQQIRDRCLTLWPGQPPLNFDYDSEPTTICAVHSDLARVISLFLVSCKAVDDLCQTFDSPPNFDTMNAGDLLTVVDEIPMNTMGERLAMRFGGHCETFDEATDRTMQLNHRLERLRNLYMIDKYGRSDPLTPIAETRGAARFGNMVPSGALALDDERREATWDGTKIPLNDQNEYLVFAKIAHADGAIVSFIEIRRIMDGASPSVGSDPKLAMITKSTNAIRTLVCRINQRLSTASVPLKLDSISLAGYKLAYLGDAENTADTATKALVETT